ncbi:MAG: hypothetical protein RLZZ429_2280 [Bacteroidota bacterium]
MEFIRISILLVTKTCNMKPVIIIVLLLGITYAIAEGIHYGSITGILLATCSLMALGYAIYLTEKLRKQMNEEAESEYIQ